MANVLSLAMKISADATGVKQQLSPLQRALQQLDTETAKVTEVFKKFGAENAAAAAAQEKFAVRLQALNESLAAGLTNPQDYARSLQQLKDAATESANDLQRAAEIVEANLTKEEVAQRKFAQSTAELDRLRAAGLLTEAEYAKALDRSAQEYAKTTIEANKLGQATESIGEGGTLKFNELSGVLSALPGPLGNVAGRISGLSSAGEGLARVFSGGISTGLRAVGASVAGLVNPFTLAAAGIGAFAATATAVANGLSQLAGRVEELSFAARQAGVDFQTIQVLEEAASRAGVSVEALATGVQKFGARLADAAKGSGETFVALQQLGFSLEEIQQAQNDPTAFAGRVSEALDQIQEPAKRAQLQIDVLGKSGENLVRAFGEIPASTQAIRRFGGAISELDRDRLLQLDTAFEDVQRSILGFGRELLTPFIGAAQSVADALAPAIGSLGNVFGNILDIVSPLTSTLGVLVNVIGQVASVILNVIGVALEPFAFAFRNLSQGIDQISRTITAGFGVINDVILSVKSFFGDTFSGVEETANATASGVTAAGGAAVEATAEQKKAYEELQRAIAGGNKSLDDAINKAGEFGQAGFNAAFEFQQALADLQEQADAGELNAEQYARGVALATAEYEKQIESLKQVQEETRRAAEEAQRRIDADREVSDQLLEQARIGREFGGDAGRARAAEQVLAVEREIARIKSEVAAARNDGDAEAVANGEERIRQLGVIRDQQQAIADGSAQAAEEDRKRLEDQRQRVDELLAAGREQSSLEQDIIAVQEQQAAAAAALLRARTENNQQEADAAAARLAQLDQLQSRLQDQQQAAEQGFGEGFARAFESVNKAVGQSIDKAVEFGDAGEAAALRLQEGIAAAQEQARDGILNKEAFDAEVERQQQLFDNEITRVKEVEQEKQRLAAEAVKQQEQQQADAMKQAENAYKEQEKSQQQIAQQQQRQYDEAQKAQQKFAEEQAKAAEAEFNRQQNRVRELNTLGSRTVQTADVRTQEGAALVLNLAANAQDPALIEARLQSKYLRQINENIRVQAQRQFADVVAIVGGA